MSISPNWIAAGLVVTVAAGAMVAVNLAEPGGEHFLPSPDKTPQSSSRIAATAGGSEQVAAIVDWLRLNVRFLPGSSDTPVSATEVNGRRIGVCRDLAHLGDLTDFR